MRTILYLIIALAFTAQGYAQKITSMTELATPAAGDLFEIVDVSDTAQSVNGSSRKITWANLFKAPVVTSGLSIGSAGVSITDDGDGALTFLGLGNGSDENLTLNFDDTANTVVISTSTGVTVIDYSGIGITTTGTITATTFVGAGGGLTLDASGFNGNLATTDNTLQEVAQKLDDLALGATDFDGLAAVTEANVDADDILAISIDGVESGITTANFQDYLESLAWAFTTLDVTTLNVTNFELSHATQNTLTASGGVLSVEGVAVAMRTGGNTFGGAQLLAEGASVALDAAGSADGAFSGVTRAGTAGATLAFGDLIYLDPTDSRWELVDANAAAAADGDARGLVGICVLAAAGDGSATTVLLQGVVRADAAFPALTIGAAVYASETAGDIVVASPTTEDAVVRVLGHAWTADEIYFNPSGTWITYDAP